MQCLLTFQNRINSECNPGCVRGALLSITAAVLSMHARMQLVSSRRINQMMAKPLPQSPSTARANITSHQTQNWVLWEVLMLSTTIIIFFPRGRAARINWFLLLLLLKLSSHPVSWQDEMEATQMNAACRRDQTNNNNSHVKCIRTNWFQNYKELWKRVWKLLCLCLCQSKKIHSMCVELLISAHIFWKYLNLRAQTMGSIRMNIEQ